MKISLKRGKTVPWRKYNPEIPRNTEIFRVHRLQNVSSGMNIVFYMTPYLVPWGQMNCQNGYPLYAGITIDGMTSVGRYS